jgi:hypothetical protein
MRSWLKLNTTKDAATGMAGKSSEVGAIAVDDLVWYRCSEENPNKYQCRVLYGWGQWITVIHPPDATWKTYFFICTLRTEELIKQQEGNNGKPST